jgi:hypothetical protein
MSSILIDNADFDSPKKAPRSDAQRMSLPNRNERECDHDDTPPGAFLPS